ncbi:MAG: triple tyrosine motif-containing protein [Bryobacteraceae bacterium]
MCNRQGNVWFANEVGLSKLEPKQDPAASPATPLIEGLRIAGVPYPTFDLGESQIAGLRLTSNQNNIEIDFASLRFAAGEILQYQYRLDGVDSDWSSPTGQRAVHYANLLPAAYRFRVRSVTGNGLASEDVASVEFSIRPGA